MEIDTLMEPFHNPLGPRPDQADTVTGPIKEICDQEGGFFLQIVDISPDSSP